MKEIGKTRYGDIVNLVHDTWLEKKKYDRHESNAFYNMLGLASLLFRNAPRRTSTLANIYFRNMAPNTVHRDAG